MNTKIVSIPEGNVDCFEGAINKLKKLAVKLGSGKIECKLVKAEVRETSSKEYVKYFDYEISGETPSLNGYELVAVLERQNKLNLVNHINREIPLPAGLDEKANYCEHCNSNRARKYLFILQDTAGKLIQVGKTCVKDFTGWHKSPEAIADWYSFIEEIEEAEKVERLTGGYTNYMKAIDMIARSAYYTDEFGYTKSGFGNKENPSTAERTLTGKGITHEDLEALGYFEKAEEVKTWVMAQNSSNDYILNLQTLIKEEIVSTRKVGFLASAYSSYKRAMSKEIEEKRVEVAKKESEHVGTIGKRSDYTLTYSRSVSFDSMYGTTYIHFFHDADDNVFVWKTGNTLSYWGADGDLVEILSGDKVTMKATLKEHSEYANVKQNVLTRCAKLEKLEVAGV